MHPSPARGDKTVLLHGYPSLDAILLRKEYSSSILRSTNMPQMRKCLPISTLCIQQQIFNSAHTPSFPCRKKLKTNSRTCKRMPPCESAPSAYSKYFDHPTLRETSYSTCIHCTSPSPIQSPSTPARTSTANRDENGERDARFLVMVSGLCSSTSWEEVSRSTVRSGWVVFFFLCSDYPSEE